MHNYTLIAAAVGSTLGSGLTDNIGGKLECWTLWPTQPDAGSLTLPPDELRFHGPTEFLIPSSMRIRSTFGGSSSIFVSTRTRHSGQRNSLLVLNMSSKHFLQKVCWHGRTLLDVSSLSRQTEHSSRSLSIRSSILVRVDHLGKSNNLLTRDLA